MQNANQSITYTKTEVHDSVGTNAKKSDMAAALGGKANVSDVHTKSQVDGIFRTCDTE